MTCIELLVFPNLQCYAAIPQIKQIAKKRRTHRSSRSKPVMGTAELHTIVTSDFADRIHGRSADSRALKRNGKFQ